MFEYDFREITNDPEAVKAATNKMGQQGWKVHTLYPLLNRPAVRILFERELPTVVETEVKP